MQPLSGFPTSPLHRRRHVDAASTKAAAPGPSLNPLPSSPPPHAPAAATAWASAAAVSPCCIAVAPRPPAASAAGAAGAAGAASPQLFPTTQPLRPRPVIPAPAASAAGRGRGHRRRPHAAGGVGGGAAASTPARETAPEPSDDEAASLITQDQEGGTADNNRGASPSLTLETLPSTGRAQDTRHPRLQSAPRLYQAHLRKRVYSH
jgi:hypothetical protein